MVRVSKKKKHQYLIDGGKVPRSTEYYRRKIREKRQAALLQKDIEMRQHSSDSSDDELRNVSHTSNVQGPFLHRDSAVYHECDSGEDDNIGGNGHDNSSDTDNICEDENIHNDESNHLVSSSPLLVQNVSCFTTRNETAYHNYKMLHSDGGDSDGDNSDQGDEVSNLCNEEEESDEEEEVYTEEASDGVCASDLNLQDDLTFACSSNTNKNTGDPFLSTQLCPCSPTTQGDALLYCLALGIRHNLTWVAMVDILKMLNLLYGYEAVTASKYYLQKLFYKQKTAKYHLYCSTCETYLGLKGDNNVESSCECSTDSENYEQTSSFFVSVDLPEQFKSLMEKEEIASEILTYRFQRKKLNDDAYEDIYDGEAYKTLCEGSDLLGNPYNFSYTFNTDGVQMGKSTKNAAWPIFISINELSPQNRKRHMIFAGVWVGKTQPNMRIFLKPFVDEANKLSSEGFSWTDSHNNQCHSRVFPLCCVVDSAARFKLLNLISYTGYYGCTFCYQVAENTSKGRRFTITKEDAPLRTHQSMIRDMNNAFKERNNPNKKKRIIKGCKGYTPLVLMKYLSLDTSFVVDSMHNSFIGVAKFQTGNLLSTCHTEFYIGCPEKKASLDAILCNICPPTTITRLPRTIEEWKMWKASEWRSWLLLYVLVCLHTLLPKKYVHHLALFSSAIYLLLQQSVNLDDIHLANQYLRKYVYLTQVYFGKTAMLYNTHLLLHICRGAVNFGPIYTHNAFQFEGENHYFMQMRTSPGHVAKQLVMRYSVFAEYPSLCESYASSEEPLKFMNEISEKSLKSFTKLDGCVLLGKGKFLPLLDSFRNIVQPLLTGHHIADIEAFEKMIFRGVRYCTSNYAKDKRHDDSYISLGPNLKARIDNILHVKLNLEPTAVIILLVTPFTVRLPDFLRTNLVVVPHVKEIVKTSNSVAIKPTMIMGQCVYIKSDKEYLADIPFGCYGD